MVTATDRDVSLRSELHRMLAAQHVEALRAITIKVQDGTITMRGQVSSFYQKQLCISCYQRVQARGPLVDGIEVGD